ncbi:MULTISPECIES: DUF3558 domain-containing protein [Gordonia]|uniref:DUF3558 domain-containing protein n=1 Tax=Gordonia TaxID=2053 RepID=UPI0009DAFACB|nr:MULTISPECIES: DUF3558 domain-containing protein [Gordonia]NKX79745.1 DUF3558 domain-containing protein [Gordonia amicalis]
MPIDRERSGLPRNPLTTRAIRFVACTILGVICAGCTTNGDPIASVSSPATAPPTSTAGIRQTDDAGRSLPFTTEYPNRWSINNDGTPYEPCTQVSDEVVEQFGLRRDSVEDVAGSDFQTARGCRWTYVDDGMSSISQFVGNILRPQLGLDGYKAKNSAGKTWYPDTFINTRRVLVGSIGAGVCSAYVQSGGAVVVTTVSRFDIPPPPSAEVCSTAVDFLRATISEIPA